MCTLEMDLVQPVPGDDNPNADWEYQQEHANDIIPGDNGKKQSGSQRPPEPPASPDFSSLPTVNPRKMQQQFEKHGEPSKGSRN